VYPAETWQSVDQNATPSFGKIKSDFMTQDLTKYYSPNDLQQL
jgi:hypothetical protein